MADLPTLYNSLIDTLRAISNATELKQDDQIWRDITHAINRNLPDKADSLTSDSTAEELAKEEGAYALARQAHDIATQALDEATAPELLPDQVLYGKTTAEHKKGNTLTLTPCNADGTAITGPPYTVQVYATFPPDNGPVGFDIAVDKVLAYMPITPLNGRVGVLFPADANRLLVDTNDDDPKQYLDDKLIAGDYLNKAIVGTQLRYAHDTTTTAAVPVMALGSISSSGAIQFKERTLNFNTGRHYVNFTDGATQSFWLLPDGTTNGDTVRWNGTAWVIQSFQKVIALMQVDGTTKKIQVKYTTADGGVDASWTDIHTGTECP